MARFRLARPAQVDLANILKTSAERWGPEGQRRYAAILTAAMRQIADDPTGPLTRARAELLPGVRSFHVRNTRGTVPAAKVRRPVHILYFRAVGQEVIEIVRVLHERMDPTLHMSTVVEEET